MFAFDAGEQGGMFEQARLAVGDAFVVHQAGKVVPDRRAEFGLVVQRLEHAGIALQAVEMAPAGLGDAGGAGLRAQAFEAGREVAGGGGQGGEAEQGGQGEAQAFHARHFATARRNRRGTAAALCCGSVGKESP